MDDVRSMYVELLKDVLRNSIYEEAELRPIANRGLARITLNKLLHQADLRLVRATPYRQLEGKDIGGPGYAHTAISRERLDNIEFCIETVLREHVPGDLIETGVWRGGASIFMRAMLRVHGVRDRKVWLADSFEGLPAPDSEKYPADAGATWHLHPEAAVSIERVIANFKKYRLLDDQVQFLKGWFKDTLPRAPIDKLAVIRLDGDMYESTWDALANLYAKLSPGGFVIVDDYYLDPCKKAIEDYRTQHGITDPIAVIDDESVYWRRGNRTSG